MDKEQILADLINALPAGISKNNLVILHLKEILSTLPSEKETAKGVIEEYIAEIGFDIVHDKGKALLIHLTNWLDKEAE